MNALRLETGEYAEWAMENGREYPKAAEIAQAAFELDIDVDTIAEAYQGEYANDVAFAIEIAKETFSPAILSMWPSAYIDWEQAAEELMQDYKQHNGHYFRQM